MMKLSIYSIILAMVSCLPTGAAVGTKLGLLETLHPLVERLTNGFDKISQERRTELMELATVLRRQLESGESLKMTFICTHNSRRSHLAQIWAQTAATYYGIQQIETFSGGTEVTACNQRTVGALRRAGFSVVKLMPDQANPRYLVQYAEGKAPLEVFSKVYSDPFNPRRDFVAVMTCSHADENCPLVEGCSLRVALPYVDPKIADGTDREAVTYDERCEQIGCEMFFLMSQVKDGK